LWPLLLAPATWFGWRAAFAVNLLLHLLGFVVFARVLRRLGLPAWGALLYLGHPTLVYYSRTLMSDVLAGVLVLAAFAAWWGNGRSGALRAGLWLGLSVSARTTNVVLLVLFGLAAAVQALAARRGHRRVLALAAGALPPLLALAAYHQVAFGKWWRGTAGYEDERDGLGTAGQFGWHVVGSGIEHYALALALVFPAMLLGALLYRGRDRLLVQTVALGFTAFFCFYYSRDRADGVLATAIVGLRFLVPVLPLYLLGYVDAIRRWLPAGAARLAPAAAMIVALVGTIGVHVRHDAALQRADAERRALYAATTEGSVILCDTATRKRLHDAFGDRVPVRVEFRGHWEWPERAGDAGRDVFVALGSTGDVPERLTRWMAGGQAAAVEAGAGVRVWRLRPSPGTAGSR
jgi:hypothetical protein